MATIIWLGPVLTTLLIVLLIMVALRFGAHIAWLIVNSIIGLAVLILLNFLPFIQITINIWSILIAAIGGIPGIILLILLDLLGIAF